MSLTLKILRIHKDIPLPTYAYEDDAAFDLLAGEEVALAPDEWRAIPTGLKMEIPQGYVGLIWDKSGLSIKNGLKCLGGVIDSGFRGEVTVGMINLSKETRHFARGSKVAQMIIQKKETVTIEEVESIGDSERGERGFGSSGK